MAVPAPRTLKEALQRVRAGGDPDMTIDYDTPTTMAARLGNTAAILELARLGAKPDARADYTDAVTLTPMGVAAVVCNAEVVRLLAGLGHTAGDASLAWAIDGGHADTIRELVAARACPSRAVGGASPLTLAVRCRSAPASFAALIAAGAAWPPSDHASWRGHVEEQAAYPLVLSRVLAHRGCLCTACAAPVPAARPVTLEDVKDFALVQEQAAGSDQ